MMLVRIIVVEKQLAYTKEHMRDVRHEEFLVVVLTHAVGDTLWLRYTNLVFINCVYAL